MIKIIVHFKQILLTRQIICTYIDLHAAGFKSCILVHTLNCIKNGQGHVQATQTELYKPVHD